LQSGKGRGQSRALTPSHDQTPKPKRSIDRRRLILSIYWIRGLNYIVAILFCWYFVKPIVPFLMELTTNRNAFVTIAFVLLGPLFAGWLGAIGDAASDEIEAAEQTS